MGNSLGLLELPVTSGFGGTSAPGDPAIVVLGEYLKACLIAYCDVAWKAATIGTGAGAARIAHNTAVVKTVSYSDPRDTTFNSEHLPALFVYRDWDVGDTFHRISDDFYDHKSSMRVLWCPTPSVQVKRSGQETFYNAIIKTVALAIAQGRDPNWIKVGETNADNLIRGTPILPEMGTLELITLEKAQQVQLTIKMDGGSPDRNYPGILFTVGFVECNDWDITQLAYVADGEADVIQAPDPGGYIVETELYPPVLGGDDDLTVLTDEDGHPLDLVT